MKYEFFYKNVNNVQNFTKNEHNPMKKLRFMSKGTVSFPRIQYNRINMNFFLTLGREAII